MAALLVALNVMAIMIAVALPVWRTWVQREREAELVFRGEQYVQAINLFSRQTGGFPTSLNALRDGKYIRKLYRDPITDEDFQPVYLGQIAAGGFGAVGAGAARGAPGMGAPLGTARGAGPGRGANPPATRGQPFGMNQAPGAQGAGPIIGVVSRSTSESLRQYNGRGRYNEWLFVSTAATQQAGPGTAPGVNPGMPGRGARGRAQQPPPGRQFPGRQMGPGRGGA
jgi:type II secretory pathway pseudopilin PulG